ncbi:MAG: hypothetical protein KDJ35_02540 [Alphaproteobacteria bacterium]|nr:hypothetical protein [Alphaproteobacteria bacterium]
MLKTQDGLRESLVQFLPHALQAALNSYQGFVAREYENEDPKVFKEHHDSCKAAIAHVELLLKLAEKFDILGGDENHDENLRMMIENARAEVSKYKKHKE